MPEPYFLASDQDRIEAAECLGRHMSTGRLSIDEFEQRLNQAFNSRTYGELEQLFHDLPPHEPVLLPAHAKPHRSPALYSPGIIVLLLVACMSVGFVIVHIANYAAGRLSTDIQEGGTGALLLCMMFIVIGLVGAVAMHLSFVLLFPAVVLWIGWIAFRCIVAVEKSEDFRKYWQDHRRRRTELSTE